MEAVGANAKMNEFQAAMGLCNLRHIDEYIYGISRDQLFDILLSRGIVTRKYFYPITSDFDVYRKRFAPEATPIAMQKSKSVFTLPLYPELSDATIVEICDIIRNKS